MLRKLRRVSYDCGAADMESPHAPPALIGNLKRTHAISTQHIFCIYLQTHAFFRLLEREKKSLK
tara:strand:- start:65 stop:256 length:192 start_codon:yes stop_codon:yes gene_type:complete